MASEPLSYLGLAREMLPALRSPGVLFLALALLAALTACSAERVQDFEVDLFNGQTFRLSEQYQDNVVVINFWYPSCPPCREEMPEFQRAWEEMKGEQVRFLGLFVPNGFDTEHNAREFVRQLGLTFDFATDHGGAIAEAYGVEFFPSTWFIDRGGEVAAVHVGALDAARINNAVGRLIAR